MDGGRGGGSGGDGEGDGAVVLQAWALAAAHIPTPPGGGLEIVHISCGYCVKLESCRPGTAALTPEHPFVATKTLNYLKKLSRTYHAGTAAAPATKLKKPHNCSHGSGSAGRCRPRRHGAAAARIRAEILQGQRLPR
jgi:hypothetical protein